MSTRPTSMPVTPSETVRFLIQEVTKGVDPDRLSHWHAVSGRIGKLPEDVACLILRSIGDAGLLAESVSPHTLPLYRQRLNEARKIRRWRKQNTATE